MINKHPRLFTAQERRLSFWRGSPFKLYSGISKPKHGGYRYANKAKEIVMSVPYEQRLNTVKNCLLCKQPALYCGIWIPTEADQKRLGTRPGKQRVVPYGMCESCWENQPASQTRVEEIIRRELTVQ
jgi:hypothetical protein